MCEVLAHLKYSKSSVRVWSKTPQKSARAFRQVSIPWRIVQQRQSCKFQLQRVANHRASKFGKALNVPPCSNHISASFLFWGEVPATWSSVCKHISLCDFPGDEQEYKSSISGVGFACWWMQIPAEQEDLCSGSWSLEGAVSSCRCGGVGKGG